MMIDDGENNHGTHGMARKSFFLTEKTFSGQRREWAVDEFVGAADAELKTEKQPWKLIMSFEFIGTTNKHP